MFSTMVFLYSRKAKAVFINCVVDNLVIVRCTTAMANNNERINYEL